MNTIAQNNQDENDFMKSILHFVKKYKVVGALKKANCYKKRVSVFMIFFVTYFKLFLQVKASI